MLVVREGQHVPFIVDAYIWKQNLVPARKSWAGHVMLTSHCGRAIYTNQFPHEPGEDSSFSGSNTLWTYDEVMQNAKNLPASIWAITLPDRMAFEKEAARRRGLVDWFAYPAENSRDATHCARAAVQALKAGGVPINKGRKRDDGGQILPATLDGILSELANITRMNKAADARSHVGLHDWAVAYRGICAPVVR
jgi:hypothetical protein